MKKEQERVRKCEGLESTDGKELITAMRIAFPIRAWFFSPMADTSVATMQSNAALSILPGLTLSCTCGWCGL